MSFGGNEYGSLETVPVVISVVNMFQTSCNNLWPVPEILDNRDTGTSNDGLMGILFVIFSIGRRGGGGTGSSGL